MTDELATSLSQFRQVFAQLAERAGARSLTDEPIHEEIKALAAAGFGKLRVPVEFGGFGVDLPALFELLAEAGQADSNVPQILRGHFTTVEILRGSPSRDNAPSGCAASQTARSSATHNPNPPTSAAISCPQRGCTV